MRGFCLAAALAALACLGSAREAWSRGAPAPSVTGYGYGNSYGNFSSAGGCLSCANVWDGFCEEKERWCNRCHHGCRHGNCNGGCSSGCGSNGSAGYGKTINESAPVEAPHEAPANSAPAAPAIPAAPLGTPAKSASYQVPNLMDLLPSDWQQ
jgi:hypothetical protein